jgi:SAM-dependent methyltransferase
LSKGPNTKDDPSEEDSERRLRRRRKGGGLRVPSDNVPRRSGRPDSGEFPPVAADDPRLAVSVAFAFADERSGRRQAAAGPHDSGGPIVPPPSGEMDGDMESPHTEPSGVIPTDPDGAGRGGADRAAEEGFEVEMSESTDREAEIVSEEGENDLTQVVDQSDESEAARRRRAANSQEQAAAGTSLSGLVPDSSSSLDYPLLEDDYEEQLRTESGRIVTDGLEGPGDGQPAARDRRAPPNRLDSVEIPIEEVLESGSGRVISSAPLNFGPSGDSTREGAVDPLESLERVLGGRDGHAGDQRDTLAESGEDGAGWPAPAAGAPARRRSGGVSDGTPEPIRRAQTVALSDADLEELDDGDSEPRSRSADAGWSMPNLPALNWGDGRGASRQGDPDPAAPLPASAAPQSPRSGVGRPMTNRDPGDSGEIIDEELIEEIEESQRATPHGSMPERTTRSGSIDIDSTLDLDGDEVEEMHSDPLTSVSRMAGSSDATAGPSVASGPHAPSPPPVSKQKPPPAPSATRAAAAAAAAAAADHSQTRPRRRRGKPWFEDIFDEDYLRTLPFLTPQATQMEAQFVMDALAISAGTQVLDVGCGYGRHAMELAARGYHVVGLDSSLPLLLRGADEAQRRGLTINFVHGDMRDMAFDAQFDGAYCLFSTFGYFDDETNKKTAQNICRALKPGARCVFEVLNRDYIIAELPLRVWWEGDGCVVLEEVDFNYFSSRLMSNRSVVFDDGRQLEQEISIRSFGLHELGKLLHSAGFRVVEVSGNMITKGRFFGAQSRDIVVIAERRIEKPGSPDTGGRIP